MNSGQYSTSLPRTVQHRFRESSKHSLDYVAMSLAPAEPPLTPETMPVVSNSCTAWVNKRKSISRILA